MAGTTSWIISNLLSKVESLFQFMHPSPALLPSSSSSSSVAGEEVTASEINLIQKRLMEDLSRLSRMLRRIQTVLHDAEEREIYDKAVELWLSELREVAYDAEDVLDEYDYLVIKTRVEGMTTVAEIEPSLKRKRADDDDKDDDLYGFQVSPSPSTSIKIPISPNMAERIMKIMDKFDEIAKAREELQLREDDGIRRFTLDDAMKRPPSSSLVNDSDIFGREDDKKKIIQLLMSSSEKEITVIPIVGMGGVGKTTLAQLIYNDPVVCEHFSPKAWVCISKEFDVVKITKEIVTSFIGHHDNNNLNDLQCMLKKALLKKKFLLILDDVWNERPDMWEALQAPFSGAGMGKIIITTRSISVARIMQKLPPHELKCLGEEKSWLLFQRHAFCGWEFDQQLNFEQIGKKIARKCGGLPLALKAIGGFLRYEVEEQIWKDVLNNNLWESEGTKNLILPALRISYNHLPSHLKPCFLYISLFPKNELFKKVELTRMWIAQGYIQLTGRKTLLEDIAFEYFEDLQRRSLFQYSQYDATSFTLHDMLHDLARSITKNEICSASYFDGMKIIPKETKHFFMKGKVLDHLCLSGALRTFFSFSSFDYLSSIGHLESIFSKLFPHFVCLRVLRLDVRELECSPQFADLIGNLKQLRYLFIVMQNIQIGNWFCSLYNLQTLILVDIRCRKNEPCRLSNEIGKLNSLRHLVIQTVALIGLPKSICQLENLLTLDIRCCSYLRELPLGISKLTNLRHLVLPHVSTFSIPREIEKMTSLQTLPHYYLTRDSQYSSIGCLKQLMNLRGSLKIHGLENVPSHESLKSASLQSKPHIKSLTLSWDWTKREGDECIMQDEAVMDGLQLHSNLKELIIDGYGGKSLPNLFPSLRSPEIENNKGKRRMGEDFWCYSPLDGCENKEKGDFLGIKHLCIKNCHNLEVLPTLPSSLEKFEVQCCGRLEYLPLCCSSGPLSRLQDVTIKHCDNLKSVNSLNNHFATLKFLELHSCALLQPNPDEYSDHSLASVSLKEVRTSVTDCPGMRKWCQRHGFTNGKKLDLGLQRLKHWNFYYH